jgi:2-amino-4-hydroxy-6-hydroxymethyldihydropteridine diphosphokinase
MANVYLGIGSNIDPENNLRLGVRELRRRFGELAISTTYKSRAVGFDGPDFLNLVVGLETGETPSGIHEHIDAIHKLAGRQTDAARFSSRPLDIDLLLYDDLIMDAPPIKLPRADVLKYSFVLRPLAEIAPDLAHPESGRSLRDHWQEFDADSHPLVATSLLTGHHRRR